MKYELTFALVAALTSSAFAAFQAPLPEFKNEKQLTEWRAEKASETTSQGYAAEETAFYTGKPYLASSSGYAFKYRSYNPELARWTSEDPSGFPDGANSQFYAPTPTTQIDLMGLVTVSLTGSTEADITGTDVTMTFAQDGKPKQLDGVIAATTTVNFTAPGKNGWIVQQVTNDLSKILNDSDNSQYSPKRLPTSIFWEAWRVLDGSATAGGLDQWNTIGIPDTTHGEYKMTGKIGFYLFTAVSGSSPDSWLDPAPESGGVLSTKTQPTWWNNNGFDRNLTMTWE